ncbi:MAG: NAD(P)/FAD-dependent oxidoreductase [Dehalococcoidaceae bacterium]|nr:NAD(P)/FAD-dependent oxidoreductase [Dehalococcoidaceae bacterium]
MMNKKVVIVGGGAGGLATAKALAGTDAQITIIDKNNHHLFQPLLFQVAVAVLSPGDIAAPIRSIVGKQPNIRVVLGEVTRFDVNARQVILKDGSSYDYDYLVVATGIKTCYYGNDHWEKFAPGLKTVVDALEAREKILLAFEKAEIAESQHEIQRLMTFVVVGGGPTGVETAGALRELLNKSIEKEFKRVDTSRARVILIEALDRILCGLGPELSARATADLEKMGVEVWRNTRITCIDEKGVWMEDKCIETSNIIWAAGTMAPPEISSIEAEKPRSGRIVVKSDCSIENHPEVFVIGDVAWFMSEGNPLPQLAPVAVQQAKYVAGIIEREPAAGNRPPFRYKDKGNVAVIGRAKAVMQIGKFKIYGFIAWLAWILVHIMVMVDFRNRFKVLFEWRWHYLGNRHGIRLITGIRPGCRQGEASGGNQPPSNAA